MKKIFLILGILFVSMNSIANNRCDKDDDCVASPEVDPCQKYYSGPDTYMLLCDVFNKSFKKEYKECPSKKLSVCERPKKIKCVNHICDADGTFSRAKKPAMDSTFFNPHPTRRESDLSKINAWGVKNPIIGKVNSDTATVVGSLTKDQVLKVVGAYMGQILYCYERQLQSQPDLKGNVAITFLIGQSGSVINPMVSKSTMASPVVEGCIAKVFNRMPFPSVTSGSTNATVPLEFSRNITQTLDTLRY